MEAGGIYWYLWGAWSGLEARDACLVEQDMLPGGSRERGQPGIELWKGEQDRPVLPVLTSSKLGERLGEQG